MKDIIKLINNIVVQKYPPIFLFPQLIQAILKAKILTRIKKIKPKILVLIKKIKPKILAPIKTLIQIT
jgi:hypothetical protein